MTGEGASVAAAAVRKPTRRSDPRHAVDLANRIALRIDEVASALGVAPRTVRKLLPRLPHFREDRVILIPVEGLRRWAEQRAREEAAEARAIGDGLAVRIRETLGK